MINAKTLMNEIETYNRKIAYTLEFCDGYLTEWLVRSARENLTVKVEFDIILVGDDFYFIDCEMSHAGNLYFSKKCYSPSSWEVFKQYVEKHGFKIELAPDYCPCCNGNPFKDAFKVTVKAP